ncbi:MAG: phosphoglucosamine mutase [Pirellulaceae bacterium]|nr:phosphoglucosamine mutase [Pirellulaceae bacterium]
MSQQRQLIISVSGLRGIVGGGLDPYVAIRYAAAFAAGLPPGPIVVTRDGRGTGQMLAAAVHGALAGLGREVLDAEIAATPTTGVLVRQSRAAGGIQISASHNPPEYNGLKLFSGEGRVISAAAGQGVLNRYQSGEPAWVAHHAVGRTTRIADTVGEHQRLVLATVDIPRIRKRRFRVLLDSNHGAGSLLGRPLLETLGCEVTVVGESPDGRFSHPAEPTEENLAGMRAHVTAAGADVGFCQDPDADRLALIDETGRYVGEEYTLALCLDHVLQQRRGPIVTNCSTSRMSEDLAIASGVPFFRSAVGEANVTGAMLEHAAMFGGEGNGGPIDPRVGYVRDSFVGMALILDALAARGLQLSQWADALPRYAMCKTKFTLDPPRTAAVLDALQARFSDAQADRLDGLRLDWPGKWLLVRASNTEPIVRAIAEAPAQDEAERLCAEAGRVIAAST